jgi:hypothetical protein
MINSSPQSLLVQALTLLSLFYPSTLNAALCADLNPPLSNEETRLKTVDDDFRKMYADSKDEIKQKLGPILLYGDSKLVLLNGSKRKEIPYRLPVYDTLKTVDHVPLAMFVLLENSCDEPLSETKLGYLEQLKRFAETTKSGLDKLDLPSEAISRQKLLLNTSIDLAKRVLSTKTISQTELQAFAHNLGPVTLLNVNEASARELANLDKMVREITANLTSDEKAKAHAIIFGEHMPRLQNSALQYFESLFGDTEEGHKVIYFEGEVDENKGVDLLVTHILDGKIGEGFYKDHDRMHRDLLSDAARAYLKAHKPAPL